jgi:hypothetical protein
MATKCRQDSFDFGTLKAVLIGGTSRMKSWRKLPTSGNGAGDL